MTSAFVAEHLLGNIKPKFLNFSSKEADLQLDFPSGWTNISDALCSEKFAIRLICRYLKNTRITDCLANVRRTLKVRFTGADEWRSNLGANRIREKRA